MPGYDHLKGILKNVYISGQTPEGKFVLSGSFIFFSTLGLPLEDIITFLWNNNFIIDWEDAYESSFKEGWTYDTWLKKINSIDNKELKEGILKRFMIMVWNKSE